MYARKYALNPISPPMNKAIVDSNMPDVIFCVFIPAANPMHSPKRSIITIKRSIL